MATVAEPANHAGSDSYIGGRRVTPAKILPPVIAASPLASSGGLHAALSGGSESHAGLQIIQVNYTKGVHGLGFSIHCGLDNEAAETDGRPVSIYVRRLAPNGAAEKDGRIRADDQILDVNGQSLVNISYAKATEILRETSGLVRLRLARPLDVTVGTTDSKLKTEDTKNGMDINCNDSQCRNKHSPSALRKRLHEARKRHSHLTEQLSRVNSQLAATSNSSKTAKIDDVLTDRLVEAETATKKAQREMIALQTSLNVSKAEFTEMETELQSKLGALMGRCNETEDIVKQFQERDNEYKAEIDVIRQRHLAKKKKVPTATLR